MKITSFRPAFTAAILGAFSSLLADTATDLNVTGYISATGDLFIDGNAASFGTEGLDAGYILNYVPGSDTVEFNASSSTASWIWRQGPTTAYVPQMQLSSANLLTLFRSGGAAGVVLNPASVSGAANEFIRLNSAGNTDGTAQRIAGYSDVRNGYLDFKRFTASGPTTGVVLGTNGGDVVTIRSGGSSDPGNVGIGTSSPSAKLEVSGSLKVSGAGSTIIAPSLTLPDGSTLTTARTNTLYNSSGTAVATVDSSGKVNFVNGLSVGSGGSPAVITPNSAAYLGQTLTNLGFRENPVTPTPVKNIGYTGQVVFTAIAQDASYVYVVGYVYGFGSIGGSSFYSPTTSAAIAKLSQNGTAAWVRMIGGSVNVNSVAVDGSGNVVVAGHFQGTTTGLTSPATNLTANGDGYDGLVVKYNSSGASQWAQRVGGTSYDVLNAVAVDGSGNVIVAGYFQGTTTGLTSPASNLTASGVDGLVVKYNASGASQWAQRVGGGSYDILRAVAVDGSGNVIVAGQFSGTTTSLSSPASNLTANGSGADGLVVKYNASGASQWAQRVGGSGSDDSLNAVAVDGSGNVIVAGYFYGTTTGLSSPASNLTSNGSNSDGLVVKYNASGASQWAQRVGGSNSDFLRTVAVDGSGNVVVAGQFSGTTTGLSSPASNLTANSGGANGFIVKYNASGASQVAQDLGGYGDFYKLSIYGSVIWALGVSGSNSVAFGESRIVQGPFMVGWSGLPLVTPADGSSASLAWGGSVATSNGVALGSSAYANGSGSAAVGAATANAQNAFASGNSTALAEGATAMGSYTSAKNYAATAMGQGSIATGYAATAIGNSNSASGEVATALGQETSASGPQSTAMGQGGVASGYAATAMGEYTSASGSAATALGSFTTSSGFASTAMGFLNVGRVEYPSNPQPTDDLLVVGNGDADTWEPSNAFALHRNGNVRAQGTVQAKGGFRTPPMGDIGMGSFTAGPTPAGQTTDGSSSPANLDAGLRFTGE